MNDLMITNQRKKWESRKTHGSSKTSFLILILPYTPFFFWCGRILALILTPAILHGLRPSCPPRSRQCAEPPLSLQPWSSSYTRWLSSPPDIDLFWDSFLGFHVSTSASGIAGVLVRSFWFGLQGPQLELTLQQQQQTFIDAFCDLKCLICELTDQSYMSYWTT